MLCNPSGINLLLGDNLAKEYQKHKALEDQDFKNLTEVRICAKYIAFACNTGAIKILDKFSYNLIATFRKTSEPCMSLDFSPN